MGVVIGHSKEKLVRLATVIFVLTTSTLFTGCGVTAVERSGEKPLAPVLTTDLFGERATVPPISEVFALTEDQRRDFQRYFHAERNQQTPPHKRVSDYLESITTDFIYRGETYTASKALQQSAGNCLAIAIVTTALANLANVEVDYELIDSAPIFESHGNHVRRSLHVRSLLVDPTWEPADNFLILKRRGIMVDYFASKYDRFRGNIDESEYFAMYYRNIAADAIEDKDFAKAYWLLRESLEWSPASPDALNMLAIVFDRAGDKVKSEEIYKYGIAHATQQLSLLRNYSIFLKREGRVAEAEKIKAKLVKLDSPNPFDWVDAGQQAYGDGEYYRAIDMFAKSVQLAPYLHEGHFGLAKAYFRLGEMRRAEHALEQAISNATRTMDRDRYELKLAALNDYRGS